MSVTSVLFLLHAVLRANLNLVRARYKCGPSHVVHLPILRKLYVFRTDIKYTPGPLLSGGVGSVDVDDVKERHHQVGRCLGPHLPRQRGGACMGTAATTAKNAR